MIEEILANLYRIEIPLPQSPLKALNSYVIKNPERNLIIDTGWNQEECMNAMQTGLEGTWSRFEENGLFYYSFTCRSSRPRLETRYGDL